MFTKIDTKIVDFKSVQSYYYDYLKAKIYDEFLELLIYKIIKAI